MNTYTGSTISTLLLWLWERLQNHFVNWVLKLLSKVCRIVAVTFYIQVEAKHIELLFDILRSSLCLWILSVNILEAQHMSSKWEIFAYETLASPSWASSGYVVFPVGYAHVRKLLPWLENQVLLDRQWFCLSQFSMWDNSSVVCFHGLYVFWTTL